MNKSVQIILGEPLESFVDAQVESGQFGSAQEVVEAGLRLLKQEQDKLEWLRQALIDGENSGPSRPYDRDALMASVREDWKQRG